MEVYLDNAATTKVFDEVIKEVSHLLKVDYGNPSSLHYKGMEAEKIINDSKEILGNILKVEKNELFFTSGGTESNNIAIQGIAKAYIRSGNHIIISAIEHPSVYLTVKELENQGFNITEIPVDKDGVLDLKSLENSITKETILVSIMHVNNEIGVINKVDEIGKIIKNKNPNTIFHVDGIQSFGKLNIFPKKCLIDALSISGHKFHGPKGIGVLYLNKKIKIKPIIFGGNQQMGIRSGTENTPGISGLALAAKIIYENIEENQKYLKELKRELQEGILKNIENTYVNGNIDESSPNILNIRFEGIKAEVLLHALESKKIYVSTGSACSSNKSNQSNTLKSLGLSNDEMDNSIRFSLSIFNTKDQIDYLIQELVEIIPVLRRFKKK